MHRHTLARRLLQLYGVGDWEQTYQVFERLGMGGMATVHRAERRAGSGRQQVALKRLLPHAAEDPELVRSFLHEARLVSGLRHRNIAQVYEVGRLGDDYFLAMEYVSGPTLNRLLRCCSTSVGLIPFPIAIKILLDVCDALAYAHAATDERGQALGIVHRDISPANIIISANGVVKLIDFGIAKTISTNTAVGIVKGKLGYIAPEYAKGGRVDRRADLWAVGVVAWELLTGRRLFRADDDFSALQLVLAQPIDPPSLHNPDVPPELDAIVMTALHRDPQHRWQNAGALRTALLGVARPSTNAELVEWVEWALKLAERGIRPARGSRPLRAMNAQRLVLEPPALPPPLPPALAPATPVRALDRASLPTIVAKRPMHPRRSVWPVLCAMVLWAVAAAIVVVAMLTL